MENLSWKVERAEITDRGVRKHRLTAHSVAGPVFGSLLANISRFEINLRVDMSVPDQICVKICD